MCLPLFMEETMRTNKAPKRPRTAPLATLPRTCLHCAERDRMKICGLLPGRGAIVGDADSCRFWSDKAVRLGGHHR
jgi:hypothetical protein